MAAVTASRYCRIMTAAVLPPVGNLLREWRQRRRLSQLDLACEAEISTRHLSFLETGRSAPSREMVMRLAEQLDIPMRERNVLLIAAGYAPVFSENTLNDPALDSARRAIDLMLQTQKPYPAFVIDRHWNIVASNGAMPWMYKGVAGHLLQRPINGLRLTLHPEGLAPRIANLAEWRAHLLARLRRQIQVTADPVLSDLMLEISAHPLMTGTGQAHPAANEAAVTVPFKIHTDAGLLSFFSMTAVFGTPVDITLAELSLEFFLPADAATAEAVGAMAA